MIVVVNYAEQGNCYRVVMIIADAYGQWLAA